LVLVILHPCIGDSIFSLSGDIFLYGLHLLLLSFVVFLPAVYFLFLVSPTILLSIFVLALRFWTSRAVISL